MLGALPDDSLKEVVSALGMSDVLYSEVNLLSQDLSSDFLINNYSHSTFCNIVNSASFTMVNFVRHTLGDSTATCEGDSSELK